MRPPVLLLSASVDPAGAVAASSETNNTASRHVEVRGNKVQNGDFEASNGTTPDHWQGSGSTSYDGHSASAGPGGTCTRAHRRPAREALRVGSDAGWLGLRARPAALADRCRARERAAGLLTTVLAATQMRVVLAGGLTGLTTFDDVRLWEE